MHVLSLISKTMLEEEEHYKVPIVLQYFFVYTCTTSSAGHPEDQGGAIPRCLWTSETVVPVLQRAQ